MGRVGHEHPPLKVSKTAISGSGGAKSDAPDAPKPLHDPDLAKVVKAWPDLPEDTKKAIKALIETHRKERTK
jgi:hypothetical protein